MNEFEQLLDGHRTEVRETLLALRELVRDTCPDATETVHLGWKALSYGRGGVMKGAICGLGLQKGRVNVQFSRGALLEDPQGLPEGTGLKMRHVKVHSMDAVDAEALRGLVQQASALVD